MGKWFMNVLIGFDQFVNTFIGADPDETISSRDGKARNADKLWGKALCPVLDWLDPDHCASSIDADEGGDAPW